MKRCVLLLLAVTLLPSPIRGQATEASAVGISPGAVDSFLPVEGRCPTFTWTAVPGAAGYELAVYALDELTGLAKAPALEARFPAGALAWTPSADRCLAPGSSYAWSVRPVAEADASAGAAAPWSEPLLFTVPATAAMDLEQALAVLREALAADPEAAAAALGELAAAGSSTGKQAIGQVPQGPINADTLDLLDSTQFVRSDTSGTLTGTLTVDPAAGSALVTGPGDAIDLGGDLLRSGTLFLHNHGTANLALGANALAATTTGGNNAALGADALDVNTTGTNNVALGNNALGANVAGSSNVAVGRNALVVNTASNNVAVGAAALDANTTGTSNTGVGNNALGANITGTLNTAVGRNALLTSTSSNNTAVGAAALDAATTGGSNTALGANALGANVTGVGNTAVGTSALLVATGGNNLAVGNLAGSAATTGSNDIYLGHVGVAGESSTMRLGTPGIQTATFLAGVHGVSPAGATQPVVIDAAGQLGSSVGGSGSGLNADLLDGLDSAAFVLDAGDTMTGLLTLDPASGFALATGSGDAIDVGGDLFKGGTRFLHNPGFGNTGVGAAALNPATTGNFNTALGVSALGSNTTGFQNTALGYEALSVNTTGGFNTAVGILALGDNTTGSPNTAVGGGALRKNTTGIRNTAVGAYAVYYNLSANSNTGIGHRALYTNSSGNSNTAVGANALKANTASGNTGLGSDALSANTTGGNNTAVGAYALDANTTAAGNVAVGHNALGSNVTGVYNTAVGTAALAAATDSDNNTALGTYALQVATAGFNTALGKSTLSSDTTGSFNTAVGSNAMDANTTGGSNTAVGTFALQAHTTGFSNTAVGMQALFALTTVSGNTAIGASALMGNTTGLGNTAIGYRAGENITTTGNNIFIDNHGYAGDAGKIRIGDSQSETFIAGISFNNLAAGAQAVYVSTSGELGTTVSSRRFKEDIEAVGDTSDRLLALRPVSFHYTEEAAGEGARPLEFGLIAEEVAEVFPELVANDQEGEPYTVRYHLLVPLLLNELQRQEARIAELTARLATIERKRSGEPDPPGPAEVRGPVPGLRARDPVQVRGPGCGTIRR